MPKTLKRLVGTVLLVAFVIVYAFFAAALGDTAFAGKARWMQIVYFALAGLAWLPPAMVIITLFFKDRAPTA